eukprot:195519_1
MSTKENGQTATDTTQEEDYHDNMDDYEDTNGTQQDKEDEGEDTLAALKKRVAAIEAEAKKISEMSHFDELEDGVLTPTKSLTPRNKSQSNPPNVDSINLDNKSSSIHSHSDQKQNNNSDQKNNDNISEEIKPPKDDDQNWPSTVEEQQELDARSVFIKQLDKTTDANELKSHFESCGTIERITIVCDKWSGQPKGCAYIQFKSQESVAAACLLNDKPFNGKIIKVDAKRTNLPPWLRFRGRGGRGRYRGRGR